MNTRSITTDRSVLEEWIEGYGSGYVYKIKTPWQVIEVNNVAPRLMPQGYGFGWEKEIVVPYNIPNKRIVSHEKVGD